MVTRASSDGDELYQVCVGYEIFLLHGFYGGLLVFPFSCFLFRTTENFTGVVIRFD